MAIIKVLEIKTVQNGNLKALAKLKIGETIFHDFRVVQQPGQRAWVSAPVTSWTGNDGKIQYKTVIEFPKRLKDAVADVVLEAWNRQHREAA